MTNGDDRVRIVAIVVLGSVLLAAVIGITVIAVLTDRDMFRAQILTFAGFLVLAGLAGFTWATVSRRRRRRLHIELEGNGNGNDEK